MIKRAYDYEHLIDGSPMLNPDAGIDCTCSDIEEDSGRDESGYMHRYVIRHNLRKWAFSYSVLTAEEYKYLLSLYRNKTTFEYAFKNEDGERETVEAYCAEISISYYSKCQGLYKNLKFEITEC